jgi:zeta-carotene desaturase
VTHFDVLVLGGGISGISAAVHLTAHGVKTALIESRPFLGGRTYSFIDRSTGDELDNGQHLMMGCYEETRKLIHLLDSDHLVSLQPALNVRFLHQESGKHDLRFANVINPLNALIGIARFGLLSVGNRLNLRHVAIDLSLADTTAENKIAYLTADEWLTSLHQTEPVRKYLWSSLIFGTMNGHPQNVSAVLFRRVLKRIFLGSKTDSSFLLPRAGLSRIFGQAADRFLKSNSSSVFLGTKVENILVSRSKLKEVVLENGSSLTAQAVISAVPYHTLQRMNNSATSQAVFPKVHFTMFSPVPIMTIYVWFNATVMEDLFVALLDSPIQWVFNRSLLLSSPSSSGQLLALVKSGAYGLVSKSNAELTQLAIQELSRFFPGVSKSVLTRSVIIRERSATFSPTPEINFNRPPTATQIENFFLAGDWTDTGYPATIEGAALSGAKAAEAVLAYLHQ